ncbi:TNF receptor-associated factor 2 isoform X2 [Ornithorhynchus anatinus]|uniref:TNF receptor-associated factor 2 isoform X2 n=1 Tax=Ornithorhynchus anatinus TaxID=9258 RepID=UPI0010A7C26C|nr:TNF receptor-associated factor 2 isoform X2 [Ornithorhynchus anatinus]
MDLELGHLGSFPSPAAHLLCDLGAVDIPLYASVSPPVTRGKVVLDNRFPAGEQRQLDTPWSVISSGHGEIKAPKEALLPRQGTGLPLPGSDALRLALKQGIEEPVLMAAANCTPPGSLDLQQPGFLKVILGTKLEDKYLCSACKNILRRPFQAQCGHRYCSYCLNSIISSGPQNCAACVQEGIFEEGISILESSSAFPDNAARREVESLPAFCVNDGCSWKGTIKEYEAHDKICPKFPLTCEGCGKKKIPREKFQDHVKTCGKCRTPCKFQVVGCSEMVENEKLQEHESQWMTQHLCMLLSFVLETKAQHGDIKNILGLGQGDGAIPLTNSFANGPELAPFAELLQRCEALQRKAVTFENIVCVLNREVERVSMTAEACSRQHRLDQEKIEALSTKVQQLERSIGLKDLAMADMQQQIHDMEASTYDGIFIWKITDFSRKRQEALAGRSPAIFSPAFYTSKYGYKMCLRIYLNGDGTGRGTHLSLFFVVMKGLNDALLRWPFNQKVTLMLLDQNNREHIIDAFRPDMSSSSFQRPVSDMNIASGCPLFCPVSKMESKNSYVRDDAIFIKAIVDLTGL